MIILLIFTEMPKFTKFCQSVVGDAIHCILKYYKPMFEEKILVIKITQN